MHRAATAGQLVTVALIGACALITAIGPGCSTHAVVFECTTSADCRPKDGGCAEPQVCGSDHVCAALAIISCCHNADCLDDFNGRPSVCRQADNRCIALTSIDCQRFMADAGGADLRDDNAVVLGATCDPSAPDACNGIELAVAEIRAQGGLPALTPGGPKRPLVVVACDETRAADASALLGSSPDESPLGDELKHLVDDVQVPVLLGTSSSALDLFAIATYAVPTNTLFIGYAAEAAAVGAASASAPDGTRLYYRTAPNELQYVPTMVRSIPDYFEPFLKGQGQPLASGQPLKVMVLWRVDPPTTAAESAIADTIQFNGKSAVANGADFRSLGYTPFTNPNSEDAFIQAGAVVGAVATFSPHLIVFAGGSEVDELLIPRIEKGWTEPTYRPRLLIGGGVQDPPLLGAIGRNDDLRRRTFGFSTRPVEHPNANFAGAATNTAAQGYDAAWLAYYAIALHDRAGSLPGTGSSSIAASIPSLLPGPGRPQVTVGAAGLSAGIAAAALGSGMDLVGASGPLDFNLHTGTAEQDVDMWYCTAAATGAATGFASSGYYYSAAQKRIVGAVTIH